ncbi:hypothetical protein RBB78_24655 [Tunturiibacter empetritectus]|uniref:hypothetical protein n=1 Tax=Tunturiibacter empetritectus TaxID=3069691 RepID=UPI003D9B5589
MGRVILPIFSVGVGDRFAHQAKAQLSACLLAAREGVEVVPVWNKSNREHLIIGSEPDDTRRAADAAVRELGWDAPYFVDADHINLNAVGRYIDPCDFFTLDVADGIGKPADPQDVARFIQSHPELVGAVAIPNVELPIKTDRHFIEGVANKFLAAIKYAGDIPRSIGRKRRGPVRDRDLNGRD